MRGYAKRTSTLAAVSVLAALAPAAFAQKSGHRPNVRLSPSQAKSIALKRVHGQVIGKIPLENESGKWEYAVSIRQGKVLREVMVNAQSGKIETIETTTQAEEAAEARAEKAATHAHGQTGKKHEKRTEGSGEHEEHGERD